MDYTVSRCYYCVTINSYTLYKLITPACDIDAFVVTPFLICKPPDPVVYIPVPVKVPVDDALPLPSNYK
jgi:hypothetical protein